MGADLYNRKLGEQSTEWIEAERKMNEQLSVGRKEMTDEERVEYRKNYDIKYNHPFYFRDSYNDSSLLWALGLSWWTDVGDLLIKPPEYLSDEELEAWYEDEENDLNLNPEGCLKFIELLESRKGMLDAADYDVYEDGTYWDTGEPYRIHIGTELTKKYERLIDFLRKGAEVGGISASI